MCVWSRCGSSSENFPWHWKFRATSLCVSGRPLCPTPTEFISHCFLCTGIYDVTANISFVLRWRISQGSCPYGVKQTANMDRPRLGSWGWVDIMAAVRELLLWSKRKGAETGFYWGGNNESDSFCNRVSFADSNAALILSSSSTLITIPCLPKKHRIKMKTSTFPGSVADCVLNHYQWWKGNTGKIQFKYLRTLRWAKRNQTKIQKTLKILAKLPNFWVSAIIHMSQTALLIDPFPPWTSFFRTA